MGTATSYTAARMFNIEQTTIVDGDIDVDGNLILLTRAGTPINAGLVKGPKGDPGAKGDTGERGADGGVGPAGADGATWHWFTGAEPPSVGAGEIGDFGFYPSNGNVYYKDDAPANWILTGSVKGAKGDRGSDGINGISTAAYPGPPPAPGIEAGDSHIDTTTGNVYEWDGDSWQPIGNIKGPKGDTGDKGDKGNTGDQGVKGDPGDDGLSMTAYPGPPTEPNPEEGDSHLNTTTGDISLWTGSAWVITGNLKGEKGDKGDKGNTGDPGPAGPATGAPPGTIFPYGGDTAPAGYLLCNGLEVNAAGYPDLYAVVGNKFGGAYPKFKVPDLRGRVPVGKDSLWFPTIGGTAGAISQKIQSGQLPNHNHSVPAHSTGSMQWNGNTYTTPNTGSNTVPRSNATDSHTHNVNAVNTGGASYTQSEGASDLFNLQPSLTLNFIIKT